MNAGDEFKRRASDSVDPDKTDDEILALIRNAKDDDQKGHLVVLYQVNRNQIRIASLLSEVVNRLETQEKAVEKHHEIVTKGAGAWRALAMTMVAVVGLFGLVGTLAGYIWFGTVDELKGVIKENAAQSERLGRLETNTPISRESDKRLTVIENNMKDVIGAQIDNRQRLGELERAFGRILEQRAKR